MSRSMNQATIDELTLTENIKNESGTVIMNQNGPVFTDTVTGTLYTLSIDDGVINKVEV